MHTSNLLAFSENIATMTCDEGLAFIERTRRQLDRMAIALPGMSGREVEPENEARIRSLCDELEAELRSKLTSI